MGMMYSAGPGGSNDNSPEAPRDRRSTLSRGTKALVIVALLVCVVVLSTGSLIVGAASGDLHFGLANVAGKSKTNNANTSNPGNLAGDAQQGGPDIIPTCDCQSTQVSSAALQLSGVGKEILVSIGKQQLYAYQDGQLQFTFLVATGRPGLPTPVGKWHVQYKEANVTFYSPWPQGSNLYYYPTHIHYALNFHDGGYYLHDSWWRCVYGPGANLPHQVSCMDEGDPPNRGPAPVNGWEYGSHGCIGMHIADAQNLYNWAPVGTTVLVVP
jgi:lipoprotein-anchoring transpeptidase ErfK/SrfK